MQALGIDPSLSGTGLALPDESLAVIREPADDQRLLAIYDRVIVAAFAAQVAVVEDLPRNAMSAGATGMAQGVIRLALLTAQCPYVLVPPASLKKFATGRGNATKADLRMALYKRSGLDVPDDNQVDAFWLREMALHFYGSPSVELPRAQVEVLDGLPFPERAVLA